MSGSPVLELCCNYSLCISPLPCFSPTSVTFLSAGGNDYLWYPFPFCFESADPCDTPYRCGAANLINRASRGNKGKVVWMVDEAVGTVLSKGRKSKYYRSYSRRILENAGTVVEPRLKGNPGEEQEVERINEHVRGGDPSRRLEFEVSIAPPSPPPPLTNPTFSCSTTLRRTITPSTPL